jgi:tetratricopeptide (TPR) repeat protein
MTDLTFTDGAYAADRVPSPSHADAEALGKQASGLDADYLFDQADAVMRSAIASFPRNVSLFTKYTRMALQRGDWHSANERAAAVRDRFPDEAAGYSDGLEALRELNRIEDASGLLKKALPKFADEPWPLRNAALLAETKDDTNAAEECWNTLCARFADRAEVWMQQAGFYRRCGRLEAADDILRTAIERFPSDPGLHFAFGQVSGERRDWDEADRRWSAARALFPNNSAVALQHALVPIGTPMWKNKNFNEAIARLSKLAHQFPDSSPIHEAQVRLLRIRGKLDDAAALAVTLTEQLPQHAGIALEYAGVLMLQNKHDQAMACLINIVKSSPNTVEAYVNLAAALSQAGRWDEAEATCKAAIARFRFRRGPLIEYANIAMRREAWPEALNRWREASRLLPAESEIRKGIATTRLALAAEIEAKGGDISLIETTESEDQGSISDLLMKFENLGAPVWGCEFAFVQRKFGAEPISLLRWAGINTHRLIEALECRFDGVGTPEQTTLHMPADSQMDYHTRDTRFWIDSHTFVGRGQMPEDKLLQQCCSRLRYLKRKLLEDLESGSKIFIFRPGAPVPDTAQLEHLYTAMRRYGDNTLLYILCGDPDHRPGTVEIVNPGLMIGYLSRLSWSLETGVGTPDFSCWVRICAEAHRLHTGSNRSHLGAETAAVTVPN